MEKPWEKMTDVFSVDIEKMILFLDECSTDEFSWIQKPLKYGLLPKHMKEILKHNFMEIEDFSLMDRIYVKHAYE